MSHFNFEAATVHLFSCTPVIIRIKNTFRKSPKWRNKGFCECRIFLQIGFRKRPPCNRNFLHGHLQKIFFIWISYETQCSMSWLNGNFVREVWDLWNKEEICFSQRGFDLKWTMNPLSSHSISKSETVHSFWTHTHSCPTCIAINVSVDSRITDKKKNMIFHLFS